VIDGEVVNTYACEGCAKTFEGTADQAFLAGWDTPERFTSHTTCDTCPISVTAWWAVVVEKQPLTRERYELFKSYGCVSEDENPSTSP
jgi:hypothetical protein